MNPLRPYRNELYSLIDRLCNESLPSDESQRLSELLESDVEAQAVYVRYLDLQSTLREQALWFDDEDFALQEATAALDENPEEDAKTRPQLPLVQDLTSPMATSLVDESLQDGPRARRVTWRRQISSMDLGKWTVAAALVAGITISAAYWKGDEPATHRRLVVAPPPELGPARLSGAVAARWAGNQMELPEGVQFVAGQRLELIEGLAEVGFANGARVVLQGPAILAIDDEGSAVLTLGRIAAASASDAAFTLRTPAGVFASRGAEFGVEVETDGSLATQVFKGSVAIHSSGRKDSPFDLQLRRDKGVRIEASTGRISALERSFDVSFVRYLPSRKVTINLADIVAGGDGFGEASNRGISLVDGSPTSDYGAPAPGDETYQRARGFAFIDGVFIPNGGLGAVQVDSIGRRFAGFPTTFGDCWGGVIMARRPREEVSLPFIKLDFHGDNYGYVNWLHIASNPNELSPEGYGLIGMHSNCGITFDLHALRECNPNMKLLRFRAQVGNLESKTGRHETDAWVIVDGELRYRRERFSREDGAHTVEVPLSDRDRFLALAITDADGKTAYDWAAFGDCVIELRSLDGFAAGSRPPQRRRDQPGQNQRTEAAPHPDAGHAAVRFATPFNVFLHATTLLATGEGAALCHWLAGANLWVEAEGSESAYALTTTETRPIRPTRTNLISFPLKPRPPSL